MSLMKKKLNDFIQGWLVGDFEPHIIRRDDLEVGIKKLAKGFVDAAHYHRNSTEFNVLIAGKIKLESGQVLEEGEIFSYEPLEIAKCEALEESIVLVIRDGSGVGDKYLV